MANQDLEKLILKLDADLRSYEKALAKAQGTTTREMRKIEKQVQDSATKVERTMGRIGAGLKGFALGALGGFSIERLVSGIGDSIEKLADIGDAADKLGIATDAYQQLAFVAKLAGASAETVDGAMKKLAVNTSEAARGQGELGKIFEANGVKLTDSNGKMLSQQRILEKVADLIKNAASEQDKAAIAQAAFGKSGIDLMNLLSQGADGVRDAMEKAKDAGVGFTEEQIRKAQELDDKWDTLTTTITTALQGTIVELADDAVEAIDSMASALDRARGRAGWIKEAFEALQKFDELVRNYGPFSDRVQGRRGPNVSQFDLMTMGNNVTQFDLMTNSKVLPGSPAGTPTKMPIKQTGKDAADAKPPLDLLTRSVRDLTDATTDADAAFEAGRDAFMGLFQDLAHGVKPIDAITSALSKLSDRLLELASNAVFNSLFGGGMAPGFSSPLALGYDPSLFANGGIMTNRGPVPLRSYAGGGIANSPQLAMYGEGSRPEAFVPLPDGRAIPVKLDIPNLTAMGKRGGYGNVTVNNYGGAEVQVRERPRPDGRRELEIEVRRIVAQEIANPYSAAGAALTARGAKNPVQRR
ncbi:MAG: hypothetical protein AB7F74_22755 [Parvibaculaceae bacterium]